MKDTKKGFIIYANNNEQITLLSNEEAGILFKNLMLLANNLPLLDMPPVVNMAFSFISQQVARDTEKWLEIREKRSQAGKLGGAPKGNNNAKQPNACFDSFCQTKQPVIVNVNVNVKVKVINTYGNKCPSLIPVSRLTALREKLIEDRLAEYDEQTIYTVFEKAEKSDFLTGRSGNGWKADFNWLMNEDNFAKVLEGRYDNRSEPEPEGFDFDEDATKIPIFE